MNKKTIVIILGIILIIAGIGFISITEPAGAEGTEQSFGISEVSEDVHPYLLQGIILVAIGLITVLLAIFKMV
ncbi:MAG: hypothetical protein ACLFSM_06805 [Thermoplasmata archaeon]